MALKKILTVDDSDLVNQMYRITLSRYVKAGAELLSASNGSQALDVLRANPDTGLVLLDINMPVMNGLDFLEHCQKDPVLKSIPVVIISTQDYREETLRGLKLGAKGYVTKPFDARELHDLIGQIVD